MLRRPLIALAAGLTGLLGMTGVLGAAAAAPCPSVRVTGEDAAAAETAAALERLGVRLDRGALDPANAACRPLVVQVWQTAEGLQVTIASGASDSSGAAGAPVEQRLVADPAVAAAWIESWIAEDDALWRSAPTPAAPTPAAPTPAAPAPAAPTLATVAVNAPGSQPDDRSHVSGHRTDRAWRMRVPRVAAGLVRDTSAGGETWDGVGAAACAPLGPWCAGLAGRRVAHVGVRSDDADDGSGGTLASRRTTLAVAATVERAIPFGNVRLVPQLSAGVARTVSERDEPAPCFSGDGCGSELTYVGDGFTASNLAMRLGGSVGLAVPLTSWLVLEGRAGAELSLGAHAQPHRHDAMAYPLAATVPITPGDPFLDLPGDPTWAMSASVGLRLEAP